MDKNTSDDLGLYPHGVRNDKGQWWCDKCNRWEDTILHGSWAEEIAEREGGTVVPLVPESELADLQRVNAILEEHVDDARSEQYKANEEAAVLRRALRLMSLSYARYKNSTTGHVFSYKAEDIHEEAIAQARKESDEQD